jgi:adenine deaminase
MTWNPAQAIGRDNSLGTIGIGREADITILKEIIKTISIFSYFQQCHINRHNKFICKKDAGKELQLGCGLKSKQVKLRFF